MVLKKEKENISFTLDLVFKKWIGLNDWSY